MKFIRPTTITDARLTSSTAPETDHAAWLAATSYTVGQRVIRTTTHRIYECLIAGVNATLPELATTGATPRWLEVSPTNRWAMFDGLVGTATSATDTLTVVLAPGRFNSLALMQVDAGLITVTLTVSGAPVYTASVNMTTGNAVGDWYQYFYEPVYQQDALVITDLVDASLLDIPAYSEGVLTVTLSKTSGTVSIGALIVGLYAELGDTQYQPTIGIIDYSRKDTNVFGNTTVIKRAYSKRMNAKVAVMKNDIDNVSRLLAQYRSTPLVWVGAGNLYTSMIIYGFYKDWEISIDNYSFGNLSLQVEGLT
jgi:hypothetical protein